MKKGQPYSRTTITVPTSLKRRMKRVGDCVNWSSVASRAFESKLAELEDQQEVDTMKDAVERLRRLKHGAADNEALEAGRHAGRDWAMCTAGPDQLERLDAFRSDMADDAWNALFVDDKGWRELAARIDPRIASKPPRQKKLWRDILGDIGPARPEFFRGFAEGAIEVWRQVRDQL
jgi:hypothetical protein